MLIGVLFVFLVLVWRVVIGVFVLVGSRCGFVVGFFVFVLVFFVVGLGWS